MTAYRRGKSVEPAKPKPVAPLSAGPFSKDEMQRVADRVVEHLEQPSNGDPAAPPPPIEADPTVGMGPKELARWRARR